MSAASPQTARDLSAHETTSSHRVFYYGWRVVFASAIGLFWTVPISVYSFPVFLKPLMQEFHAGRSAISLGFTLQLIAGVAAAPFLGRLLDRFGSRRVILIGTAIFASILLANKIFPTSIGWFYLFYVLLGLSLHAGGPIAYGNVVCRWFDRRRGLALGLTMTGIGLGAVIMPSFAQFLIARYGWRSAYAALGAAAMLVALPVVGALLKEKPQDLGLLPDGEPATTFTPANEKTFVGLTAAEALRSGTFWLMTCAFFLVSASVQGCMIHLSAMLSDRGMSAQTAAMASSVIGAAVLLGRVGTGYVLDRFFAPRAAAGFFIASAAGIGLLLWRAAGSLTFVGAFLVGLGLGAEVDIIAFMVSRYFGLRAFGQIYSYVFAGFALAAALGPLIMGVSFDLTGSYHASLIVFLVATLLGGMMMVRLGPYRYGAVDPVRARSG
jgi:MFS family permease